MRRDVGVRGVKSLGSFGDHACLGVVTSDYWVPEDDELPLPDLDEVAETPRPADPHAVGEMLLTLSKAARDFTLYEASNQIVRHHIEAYREASRVALEGHATVELVIHPFEIRCGSTPVYKESDRERSLAFRLFRDGVRGIAIAPQASWDELLRLLEVFSVRFVGVRQQEDDMVTILRRAELPHVTLDAVEGFVPDEDDPEGEPRLTPRAKPDERTTGFGTPLPRLVAIAEPTYQPLPEHALAHLREEENDESMAPSAILALRELLYLAVDPDDEITEDDVLAFALEVGQAVAVEGRADLLLRLVRDLRAALGHGERVDHVVRQFVGAKVLDHFLRDVEPQQEASLVELMGLEPGDHVEHALDLLASSPAPSLSPPGEESGRASVGRRRLLTRIVVRLAGQDPEPILARLATAPPALAADLFHVLQEVAPTRLVDAALGMAEHPDPDIQLEVLKVVATARGSCAVGRAMHTLLAGHSASVRVEAARVLVARAGDRAYAPILAQLEKSAKTGIEVAEAEAFGRLLAQASSDEAMTRFHAWAEPGRLSRLLHRHATPEQHLLQHAALAGLSEIATPEAREVVAHLAKAEPELAARCQASLQAMGAAR
ncbi:MAG: hypothetical protein IT379_16925 [Deltaproteobacteria bacterium]|nr:hypothetical protein [Deltaproteobacteria bacterium]